MKITFYVLSLNYGGAERVITNIANILSKDNDVEIKSIYNFEPFYHLNENIKITYLTSLRPNKLEFLNAIKTKNILKIFSEGLKSIKILYNKKNVIIKSLKNDASDIAITTRKEHNYYLTKYGKKIKVKIGQEHNDFSSKKDIKRVIKGAKNLDYFMPASEFLSEKYSKYLERYNVKIKYIPHSIKSHTLLNLKKENQIIIVGRLEKIKAVDDAIRVFELVQQEISNLKLIIVGSGSEEKYLKSFSSNKNIIFKGQMGYDDILKEYEKSLLLLSTSKSESFGLVVLEAAICGIPTVAFSSANGFKEIIKNKETGILIENRNIAEMAFSIVNLLNDKNLLNSLGKSARKNSNNYSEEVISKEWDLFINNLKG